MKILICGQAESTLKYVSALRHCGADSQATTDLNDMDAYDGLLLPGGGDIDPSRFGEANHGSMGIDQALDAVQFEALAHFASSGKPVLGICKGMQVINVYFGGTLTQHLPSANHHRLEDPLKAFHREIALPGTKMDRLYGSHFIVNTFHHQGCSLCGKGLNYTAFSDDGVPEAVEHDCLPIVGVQWHPERMAFEYAREGRADGGLLFRAFLQSYAEDF